MSKERIGIMGGTFNPIHSGHIRMALAARDAAALDQVLVLPSGVPPHKQGIAPAEDRWRMVCAACAQESALTPCRMELDREGTTYTVDTLSILHEKYPRAEFFYIIGTDSLMELHTWRRIDDLLGLCTFLVCPRVCAHSPEAQRQQLAQLIERGGKFQMLDMDVITVASTDIRAALQDGSSTPLLPVPVREYCAVKGLYGMPARISDAEQWMAMLFRDLTVKRFAHTLAVADTARHLAQVHHLDALKAEIAGLLHDCAKCLPQKDMQALARDKQLTEDESLLESSALLHSVTGAYLAQHQYGVSDPEIIQAIAAHTTGRPGMTKLDMAVYLADKIEPTRQSYPLLDMVRVMARLSLERAMTASMEGTANYVRKGGKPLHPMTLDTLRWLKTLPESQSNS